MSLFYEKVIIRIKILSV